MAQLTVDDVLNSFKELIEQAKQLAEQEQKFRDTTQEIQNKSNLLFSNKDLSQEERKRFVLGLLDILKEVAEAQKKRALQKQADLQSFIQFVPNGTKAGLA